MALIQASRRGFLTGLGAVLCAPAIVRITNIMPISSANLVPPMIPPLLPVTRLDVLYGYMGVRPELTAYRAIDSVMTSMFADQMAHPIAEKYRIRAAEDLQRVPVANREMVLRAAIAQLQSGVPELTKLALGIPV